MIAKRNFTSLWVCVLGLSASLAASADPLHVYLTYSGAPETSIDINVIEPGTVKAVEIYYDTKPHHGEHGAYPNKAEAKYHKTHIEQTDGRTIHAAALTGLKPDQTYYFIAGEATNGFSKERAFRTLPGGKASFRFVDGGDMGVQDQVVTLLKQAARQNPYFAVIGGDIAYEEELSGFATWDDWLSNWEYYMVTPDGLTIPLVLAIGNHEVQSGPGVGPSLEDRSPWYVGLFGRQGANIYHEFRVGDNAVFFLLDTNHLVPHLGEQSDWLTQRLDASQNVKYRFAAYHVPLYPALRPFDGAGSKLGREAWLPIFDRYGLTAAFEHHDHVLKRTKPLKNGKVVEKGQGTIYFGDGCFGKDAREVEKEKRWYNDLQESIPHFWLVEVTSNGLQFKAIDESGKTVDDYSLP